MNGIWNETIWKGINDEVRKVVGTIRVAQKIFPTIILDNPSNIPHDIFNLAAFTIDEGLTTPLVEITAPFQLTPNQVGSEASLQTGLKLAKLRAAELAGIEDLVFFQGVNAALPAGVVRNLTLQSVNRGLLGLATPRPAPDAYNPPIPPIQIPPLPEKRRGPALKYGENTFNAVVQGINLLNAQLQPGPFALILEYSVFADTYATIGPGRTITADLIAPLVTGGFLGTTALPVQPGPTGLLVSLGGEPTTLYVGIEATTAFIRKDDQENHFFRVFERVQFNARDARAFVRLDFQ
jgi:uncharacterized linocin/CFP29 family protein